MCWYPDGYRDGKVFGGGHVELAGRTEFSLNVGICKGVEQEVIDDVDGNGNPWRLQLLTKRLQEAK